MRSTVTILFKLLILIAGVTSCSYAENSNSNRELSKGKLDDRKMVLDVRKADLRNHYADLNSTINSQNADKMELLWSYKTKTNVSHTPIVVDGIVFFAEWGGTVYAANAVDGTVLWSAKVEEPKTQWPWHGFCGVGTYGDGTLFEASAEGNVFALNAETGKVIWKKRFTDDPEGGNCGELYYYDGVVYIPVSSVEEPLTHEKKDFTVNFQGKVVALDGRTGELVWELQTVQPPHTGVPVWSGFAIDPQTNTLFFTTGNNYTGEATEYSDAIIAVDAKTGDLRWARQMTQQDVWTMAEKLGPDYDFGAAPQLFEAVINGERRSLLGAGQKSGVYWVLDRNSGETVWQTVLGYGHIGGGFHAEASIGDGVIYAWSNNAYPYKNPEQHPMDIAALDMKTGKYLWMNAKAQPAELMGTGYLASDVYFVPSLDGRVRGYRADDGKLLWTSSETGPIGTSLNVKDGKLYFGTGVPKHFGGGWGEKGVFVFAPKQ